jgi:hypothetical protein
METTTLDKDIKVFYITAKSYPDKILEAHNQLHALGPFSPERNYFGISRPEANGAIVYRAATEEKYEGEAKKYNCDTLILKKGKYITLTVNDFKKDPESIANAFQKLLSNPNIDPQGYCVEWYYNDRDMVRCMVRLNE